MVTKKAEPIGSTGPFQCPNTFSLLLRLLSSVFPMSCFYDLATIGKNDSMIFLDSPQYKGYQKQELCPPHLQVCFRVQRCEGRWRQKDYLEYVPVWDKGDLGWEAEGREISAVGCLQAQPCNPSVTWPLGYQSLFAISFFCNDIQTC